MLENGKVRGAFAPDGGVRNDEVVWQQQSAETNNQHDRRDE